MINAISGLMSWSDACVCYPSLPCDFDWSKQLTGLKHFSLTLSDHLFFPSHAHTDCVLFLCPAFSFFSHLALLQLSLTHLPSSPRSGLKSHISDSMGTCTTSTCSSADVCINHTEGPVVLACMSHTHTHTHSDFFTPTSELVDSGLLRHIGEGNDAL